MQESLIGKTLRNNISTNNGGYLLVKGTLLQREHIQLLVKNQIFLKNTDVAEREQIIIEEANKQIKNIFCFAKENKEIPLQDVEKVIMPTIQGLAENQDIFFLLSHLQEKDDYTYKHNIGVALLSTLLGKWINISDEELSQLAVAALLHDIGKVKIPEEILSKPGKLTDKEYKLMKKHTVYGYDIIQNTKDALDIYSFVAIQHHEREDGSGYPFKLKSSQIKLFSKIVAIADIFHAMTSKRVYRDPAPFHEVMNQMNLERFGKLNPQLLNVFINRMMIAMIGKSVLLSDGRKGKICFIHPHYPTNPLIESEEEFIDLHKTSSLRIEQILH